MTRTASTMIVRALACVALLFCCGLAMAEDFDAFFEQFAEKRAGIQTLKADFVETSIVPDDVFESEGRLVFAKPRRIVRRTIQPFETTFLVDRETAYQYEPEVAQLVVADLEEDPQAEIIFLGFQSDATSMREAFDITLFTVSDDMRGTRGLRLIPKAAEADRLFQEVRLYLRDEDYLPYRVEIDTDESSRMILEVNNLEVNPKLEPEETQLALPEGTRIIQNDAVLEIVGDGGRKIPQPIATTADTPDEANAPIVEVQPLDPAEIP